MQTQITNGENLTTTIPEMSESEFLKFSKVIHEGFGINLPTTKRQMLTSRLQKRLRILDIRSYGQYYEYVFSKHGDPNEIIHMMDAVTTNRTEFFRETHHFKYLITDGLKALVKTKRVRKRKKLLAWSAGCSSGEEPYTLAMTLAEFLAGEPEIGFAIRATDLSTGMLNIAKRAIYPKNKIQSIPDRLKRKYIMRGKGAQEGYYRMVPELRRRITFRRLNLIKQSFEVDAPVDILLCRNVIIYFDKQTQIELFKKFFNIVEPGGFLFIGHSETLDGVNRQFERIAATIYRKPVKED